MREIAQGQTKLSIFNGPVCIVRSVRERVANFFFSLPPSKPPSFLDELSMLWSNQYAEARFKAGITARSLQTHEGAISVTDFLLRTLPCSVLGTWVCILIKLHSKRLHVTSFSRPEQAYFQVQIHGFSHRCGLVFHLKCRAWAGFIPENKQLQQSKTVSNTTRKQQKQ